MRKRILYCAAATVLAASMMLTGCNSGNSDKDNGNDVTVTQDAGQNVSNGGSDESNSQSGNSNDNKQDGNGSDTNTNTGSNVDENVKTDNNGSSDQNTVNTDNKTGEDSDSSTDYSLLVPAYATGEYKKKDLKSSFNPDKATKIVLDGSAIEISGDGAEVDGNKIKITAKGTYLISGKLDDGQIIVNAGDDDDVRLILNGADITCSNSSPIYAINADKLILTLVDGSVNTFTDGSSYVYADAEKEEPNAAIFSDCDLSINGNGTLNVNGKFQHAIRVKADMKITSGTISLNAVEKGIKVKKTFAILDGTVNIKCGDDGINAGMAISIDGGILNVAAEDDGIQSDEQIIVNAGTTDTSASKKGFKAPIFTPNGGDIK